MQTAQLLAQMVAKVFAEVASGLASLLMKCAPIAGAEAKSERADRWSEWVGHGWFLTYVGGAPHALPIR